jgi:hypothetical protein
LVFLIGLTLAGTAALAAGVDGVWEGQAEGRNGPQTLTFTLKADGAALTGKVTSPRGDTEISDGKVDGDQITFKTALSFGGNNVTIVYTGKVNGDEIAFKRVIQEFDRSSEFTAKRK